MDEKFQDRIDNYLLNRMDAAEKTEFLREVEQDEEKEEQLEFTKSVKDSICSREEKLQALAQFQRQYEEERERSKKKIWLWAPGVAAVLVVGFFAIKPLLDYDPSPENIRSPMDQIRGGDEVFYPAPTDSAMNDTIKYYNEKKVNPDE